MAAFESAKMRILSFDFTLVRPPTISASKRVISADILTHIEKYWKDAFEKEQRNATAQYLIDKGFYIRTTTTRMS